MEKSSNKLVDLSVAFAIEILNLVKYLKSQHETIICNQIGRAGTSIGAKKHEAVMLRFMHRRCASWHNVPLHAPKVRFMAQRAASYGEAVLHAPKVRF